MITLEQAKKITNDQVQGFQIVKALSNEKDFIFTLCSPEGNQSYMPPIVVDKETGTARIEDINSEYYDESEKWPVVFKDYSKYNDQTRKKIESYEKTA